MHESVKEIKVLMAEFDYESLCIIPVSATEGDNIVKKSKNMPWYSGSTLLSYLEQIDVTEEKEAGSSEDIADNKKDDR